MLNADLYQILGLTPAATAEDIREAYRRLRSSAHPDKQGDASMFIQIQQAYDVLSDPERRADYDATGNTVDQHGDQVKTAVIELLMTFANQIDPDRQNPIDFAKRQVQTNIGEMTAKILSIESGIKHLEKVCKKLKRKSKGDNFVTASMRFGIEQSKKQIGELQKKIQLANDIITALDDFCYELEQTMQLGFYRVAQPWSTTAA